MYIQFTLHDMTLYDITLHYVRPDVRTSHNKNNTKQKVT